MPRIKESDAYFGHRPLSFVQWQHRRALPTYVSLSPSKEFIPTSRVLPSYLYAPLAQPSPELFQQNKEPSSLHYSNSSSGSGDLRLLKLEPGHVSDPIFCSLSNVSLSSLPSFEAISYVWGDKTDTKTIVCSQKTLKITTNLHSALRHLRFRKKPRMLWADAICINQENLEERSRQVKIMGEIYSRARRVLIWLGEEHAQDAFDIFELVDTLVHRIIKGGYVKCTDAESGSRLFHTEITRLLGEENFKNFKWEKLQYLLRNPWFERVWIVQELTKSTKAKVIWGHSSLNWLFLSYFFFMIIRSAYSPLINAAVLASDRIRLCNLLNLNKVKHVNLLYILTATRPFKSTDPRDKLYAVYGLAKDRLDYDLKIDYELDPAEVFTAFAVSDIVKQKSLRCLYFTSHRSSTSGFSLPSWVPDWSRAEHNQPFITLCQNGLNDRHGLSFKAGADSVADAAVSIDSKILSVRGKAVDELLVVAKYFLPDDDSSGGFELEPHNGLDLLEKYKRPLNRDLAYLTRQLNECHQIALLETPVSNINVYASERGMNFVLCFFFEHDFSYYPLNSQSIHTYGKALAQNYWFGELITRNYSSSDIQTRVEMPETLLPLSKETKFTDLEPRQVRRRFCRTKDGRLGWAPFDARPGDIVCVLFGCNIPLVLRPTNDGFFQIIGDCYIQGIMHGEAVHDTSIETQTLHII